jgi:phosphatidylglycerophosphatase A
MVELWRKIKEFIVTGFFTGYIPFMPGVFGTLIGVVIYVFVSPHPVFYYILLIALIIIAIPLSDYAERVMFKEKNCKYIVIDEIVGYLVAMVSFHFDGGIDSIRYMVIGFLLFRLFDVWKPYIIRKSMKLEGGIGIVFDDILAGVVTNLFLQFLRLIGPSIIGF